MFTKKLRSEKRIKWWDVNNFDSHKYASNSNCFSLTFFFTLEP